MVQSLDIYKNLGKNSKKYEKAKVLKNFLIGLEKNNNDLVALFGEWGIGKSTLIYKVKEMIEEEEKTHNVIIFNAWKYEFFGDLALSISSKFEQKLSCLNKTISFIKKHLKKISSVTIKGIQIDLNSNNEDDVDALEGLFQKLDEDLGDNRIYFFIDDLDRCDSKSVVELLIKLKLFFSLSRKITFIVTMDKEFILEAINAYYQKNINAEHYLEKMISYQFYTPYEFDNYINIDERITINYIRYLFVSFNIKTPRKIIKIMNKIEMLFSYYNGLSNDKSSQLKHTEYIVKNFVFILYLVIKLEFEYTSFKEFSRKFWDKLTLAKIRFIFLQDNTKGDTLPTDSPINTLNELFSVMKIEELKTRSNSDLLSNMGINVKSNKNDNKKLKDYIFKHFTNISNIDKGLIYIILSKTTTSYYKPLESFDAYEIMFYNSKEHQENLLNNIYEKVLTIF